MRIQLERRLSGGRIIRAVVESLTTEGHAALTSVREHQAINIALVNVLDVTQTAIGEIGPKCDKYTSCDDPDCEAAGRCLAVKSNPVGGACGDDPERISDR